MKLPPRAWPGAEEVHVWRAELDLSDDELDDLYASLSPEERDAAGRYRHVRERARHVAARGWLRHLLGGYLGDTPLAVVF